MSKNQIVEKIESDQISLKELVQKIHKWIKYLITKWKLIIGLAALGGILGYIYASNQRPIYLATLTFVLEEDKGNSNGAIGLASSFGFDIGSAGVGAFSSTNIIELMKSRLIVEKVLLKPVELNEETISIAEYYIRINKILQKYFVKTL